MAYYTGHTDNVENFEEHDTYEAALEWIEKQKDIDPEGVSNGKYYLDALEEHEDD